MSLTSQLLRPEDLTNLSPEQQDLLEQRLEGAILRHLAQSEELQRSLQEEARTTMNALRKAKK